MYSDRILANIKRSVFSRIETTKSALQYPDEKIRERRNPNLHDDLPRRPLPTTVHRYTNENSFQYPTEKPDQCSNVNRNLNENQTQQYSTVNNNLYPTDKPMTQYSTDPCSIENQTQYSTEKPMTQYSTVNNNVHSTEKPMTQYSTVNNNTYPVDKPMTQYSTDPCSIENQTQYSTEKPMTQYSNVNNNPYPTEKPMENTTSNVQKQEDDDEPDISPAEVSLMRKVLRSQLVESKHEVEVVRSDSKSPLYSVKTFEQLNLRPELLKGVFEMGFNAPSKIQETTLPTLVADPPTNMIAQSQSGTGKTAAFVLSCLSRVDPGSSHPQVLILSPTNELAFQTGQVAKQMGKYCTGIEFRYAVKGQMLEKGHKIREQVVIGTPGKVWDWSKRRHLDLGLLRCFVLDEADIMISLQGHLDTCIQVHMHISRQCQTMLFSATYASEVMDFAEMIITDPIIIRLKREEETLGNVKQYYIECYSMGQKYLSICNLYGVLSVGQVIIFCRTKRTASWLGEKMVEDGHSVGYLSSDLEIQDRMRVLKRFRDGEEKVLITTNVCARGIDIEQVTIVVNFDLPVTLGGEADCETYLHRIGRSGRFGRRGIAINMVADDRDLAVIRDIEEHFGRKILRLDATDVDELEGI